jgi:hypothetical protein
MERMHSRQVAEQDIPVLVQVLVRCKFYTLEHYPTTELLGRQVVSGGLVVPHLLRLVLVATAGSTQHRSQMLDQRLT